MRIAILITLVTFSSWNSIAQDKYTREETMQWLREKLGQNHSISSADSNNRNFTKMCVNFNLLPDAATAIDVKTSKFFKDKIVSDISWRQQEIKVQNNIFIDGKLTETFTYQIPLTAIVSATVTNCQRNISGNVDAYVDRPIFIRARKNTTRIVHIKNGHVFGNKSQQYYLNNKDADWDSIIPIAGNWDSNPDLQEKIVKAFTRLAQLNENEYSSK